MDLCHRCLAGEKSAIEELQERFSLSTTKFLSQARGSAGEAEEVVVNLWADLLISTGDRPPRLTRYDGSCELQTWLNAVALNLLMSLKRRQLRWQKLIATGMVSPASENGREEEPPWMVDQGAAEATEAPLVELMSMAVEAAFLACDAQDFVLLQLAHCHRLQGLELGLMFGCHNSVISRRLRDAEKDIATRTMSMIRQVDPELELTWEDFVTLCRVAAPACLGLD